MTKIIIPLALLTACAKPTALQTSVFEYNQYEGHIQELGTIETDSNGDVARWMELEVVNREIPLPNADAKEFLNNELNGKVLTCAIIASINENGKIYETQVFGCPNPFVESINVALKRWQYEVPIWDNQATKGRTTLNVRFMGSEASDVYRGEI